VNSLLKYFLALLSTMKNSRLLTFNKLVLMFTDVTPFPNSSDIISPVVMLAKSAGLIALFPVIFLILTRIEPKNAQFSVQKQAKTPFFAQISVHEKWLN
jgi:hypothetical protein